METVEKAIESSPADLLERAWTQLLKWCLTQGPAERERASDSKAIEREILRISQSSRPVAGRVLTKLWIRAETRLSDIQRAIEARENDTASETSDTDVALLFIALWQRAALVHAARYLHLRAGCKKATKVTTVDQQVAKETLQLFSFAATREAVETLLCIQRIARDYERAKAHAAGVESEGAWARGKEARIGASVQQAKKLEELLQLEPFTPLPKNQAT